MMSEMNDVSRVVFAAAANTAIESLRRVYTTRGQIWTLVVSKNMIPDVFSKQQSEQLFFSNFGFQVEFTLIVLEGSQ